jgi:para-nitrobenzyl esterase
VVTRLPLLAAFAAILTFGATSPNVVHIDTGNIEGTRSADSKVRIFEGIPFAAPPVGPLRWKAPQPAASWSGIRKTVEFGPRCMQGRIYTDMVFRDNGPSEDCLYLNVWTPARSDNARLPVMVWIYGGGFAAGASSEPRQDGEHLAEKGVVVVSFNYRLNIFGFFSNPELAKESGHDSSGNYGLLDQFAALEWVHRNIPAFGGDPGNVTIFGESAGSLSVSALMASPLSKDLFRHAIGESGAFFGPTLPLKPLKESEEADQKFATTKLGTDSIEALRAKPASEILEATLKERPQVRFAPNIDGYFLPESVSSIFEAGKQAHVPLLAGFNHDEGSYHMIFGKEPVSVQNYESRIRALYGSNADEILKLYPAKNDEEAKRSAQALAGDRFIAFATWKWIQTQCETGGSPVYRYEFDDAPPTLPDQGESRGAYHSSEIEFVFGNLASKKLPWKPADYKLSELMSTYWTNFAKTGNPNGPDLVKWPVYDKKDHWDVMYLSTDPHAAPAAHRARYEFLDHLKSFDAKP